MTREQAKTAIENLVERFAEHRDEYHLPDYNEAKTRQDFINPFFKTLGWDINNENNASENYREVIYEDRVVVRGKAKAPDYGFRLAGSGKKRLFYVEAKKPSVALKANKDAAYQLRRYGSSAQAYVSVLTNFEEFIVYDCSKVPNLNDSATVARLKHIGFEDYIKEFDFIYDTFSHEAVTRGRFDKFIQASAKKKGTDTLDKRFVESLDHWRKYLATSIAVNNKKIDDEELNYAVQLLIDRVIFLRFCEDRGVEPYAQLQKAVSKGDSYKHLLDLFNEADAKYNSGLFDFDKDKITPSLKLDNKVLKTVIDELYYPKCNYEFSVMPVEILGNAYEQFLGKVIRITPGRGVKIEEKPEVRKAGGVYYTPQYIVEYIVKNTVGKLTEGKTPKEVEALKIVDPACGSGSFLLGAFEFLLNYHTDWYHNNLSEKEKKKGNIVTHEGKLTTHEKKRILLNNIYGVDLDANAVEVSKLSLLLKCMEGETEASIQQQKSMFHERVLPSLEDNIKDGNSLIDTDFYDSEFDLGYERKIKPFSWKKGFPSVFKQGGFDSVIGNPPYVRMQTIDKIQTDYFKEKYKSATYGNYDLYVLFIESCLNILSNNGMTGLILPHKFFQAEYGESVRNLLAKNKNVYQINDFTTNQIFDNATTYTCLLFLNKKVNTTFNYSKVVLGASITETLKVPNFLNIPNEKLLGKWIFNNNEKNDLLIKISNKVEPLKHFAKKIFKGSSTGNDNIYLVKLISSKKTISKIYSQSLNSEIEIETELLMPFIYGSDVRKHYIEKNNTYLIFPYRNGKLLSFEDLERKYPLTKAYFDKNKKDLLKRKLPLSNFDFYKYSAARSIGEYNQMKILIPDMLVSSRFALDKEGIYYHGPAIHSIILDTKTANFKIEYLLGIISSKLFWFFVSNTSTALRGNAYRLTPEYINTFGIKNIQNNKNEKFKYDEIIKHVDLLLKLNEELKLKFEIEQITHRIDHSEGKINKFVYELYELTPEEIAIVEGGDNA